MWTFLITVVVLVKHLPDQQDHNLSLQYKIFSDESYFTWLLHSLTSGLESTYGHAECVTSVFI